MLKAGDMAPEFELPDADMTMARLSDYKNKQHLVLFFYVRDNTPACTAEAIEFSDLESDFAKLGFAVVGVSKDDCISHGVFRDKQEITLAVPEDAIVDGCRRRPCQRRRARKWC